VATVITNALLDKGFNHIIFTPKRGRVLNPEANNQVFLLPLLISVDRDHLLCKLKMDFVGFFLIGKRVRLCLFRGVRLLEGSRVRVRFGLQGVLAVDDQLGFIGSLHGRLKKPLHLFINVVLPRLGGDVVNLDGAGGGPRQGLPS